MGMQVRFFMPLHRMVSAAPRHTFCVNSLAVAVNTPHNPRMKSGDCTCVWQAPGWPNWRYDLAALAQPLA